MKLLYIIFLYPLWLHPFKLDRVILATDKNPIYLDNWPVVAKAWTQLVGLKPTLAFIADEDVEIDESLGDVIRFKPISGVPDGFYAQVIRLLLPAMFPNDFCILSDIDMLPMNKNYFLSSVGYVDSECFVIYKTTLYYDRSNPEYAMCYVAGKGTTFQKLFELKDVSQIKSMVKAWHALDIGWATDQRVLYSQVHKKLVPVKRLNHHFNRRLDREELCKESLFKSRYYVDYHLPRPFDKHKDRVYQVCSKLGIKLD